MTALAQIIKDNIRKNGPMNLAEYMTLCLGHPDHGYYMTRDPFGKDGDFITAPEISQMFGELIGAWLADSWIKMGSPNPFVLLECGPGRGTLMADILRVTKAVPGFHESMQLHLLENSPILRKRQEECLKGYGATWHSDTESLLADSPLLVVGNEFLDALPVRQFVFSDTGWQEKVINLDINDTIRLYEIPIEKEAESLIPDLLIPPKLGDQVEVSLQQKDTLGDFIKIILKQGGISLFIDYGYTHAVPGDTLQALQHHSYCDILDNPGEADITAHVNFTEIARFAMEKEMTVHDPVPQGEFLKRLGIEARAENLIQSATPEQKADVEAALKRLTGVNTKEGEMGDLFKVIAFSSDPDIELAGFA